MSGSRPGARSGAGFCWLQPGRDKLSKADQLCSTMLYQVLQHPQLEGNACCGLLLAPLKERAGQRASGAQSCHLHLWWPERERAGALGMGNCRRS
jgi:hypothetical protein